MAEWRIGSKVPLNVYDEDGAPVCQCHYAGQAQRIVASVNRAEPYRKCGTELRRKLEDIRRSDVSSIARNLEGVWELIDKWDALQ